jgi:ParB-like chromosome segregation protein Spo0J
MTLLSLAVGDRRSDSDHMVLAGHGRLVAAKLLRLPKVPCLRPENMTPEQKRAYVIADNKLGLNSRWDEQLLADEIRELVALDPDFNIEVTGFLLPEIDNLLEEAQREDPGDPRDDSLPLIEEGPSRLTICGFAAPTA